MRSVSGLFVVLLLASTAAWGQQRELSLSQAVDAALQNQPDVRSALLGVDLSKQRTAEAQSRRLPEFRITQVLMRSNNPVFVFGSLLEQGRFGPHNFSLPALNSPDSLTNVRTAISGSLPLFDGRKTSSRITQARIGQDRAALEVVASEQQIRFEALRQYFHVLAAQERLAAATAAVGTADSDLSRTESRVDAGLAVESDRLAAQVQLAEFTSRRIESEGELGASMVALNILMGFPAETRTVLTGALGKHSFSLVREEELIQRAMLHRPDYLESASAVKLAETQISETRSEYLPEINVFGSFGASGRNWTSGNADYAAGASLTLNLFDPGRASRISQAEIQQRLAGTSRDRIRDRLVVEVARAYHEYRAALQHVEVAEASRRQASEALRIIQDRYDAGLTTITDVLRAETAFVNAAFDVTSAVEAQYVSYAKILLATGELNDVHDFDS